MHWRVQTGRAWGLSIETEGGRAGFRGENKHKDMMWSQGGDLKGGCKHTKRGWEVRKQMGGGGGIHISQILIVLLSSHYATFLN